MDREGDRQEHQLSAMWPLPLTCLTTIRKGWSQGMDFSSFYDPANFTYPFGAHIAIVEVDKDTGKVDLKRFIAVDDVGNVINPMIVDGQIHGGLAQGIGQALFEGAIYDEDAQLINGSYMDYTMPRADDLPSS
jgi:carbon-monoxide dehydrogenase large subunit